MKQFMRMRGLALLALAIAMIGCASTRVKKNPGPHDRGLRYYLPKPYLLVDRATKPKAAGPDGKTELTPIPNMVKLTLEYLPDFSEEYSIHARAGIGKNTTKVSLQDGWRLEKIDVDVDSQATEFVTALATLLGTEPKILGTKPSVEGKKGGGAADSAETRSDLPSMEVEAHDVPLGYYESVIAPGPDGRKRMYGWRYVGFAPYANCPIDACGVTSECCQQSELYGLVSVGKTMYFRKLKDLAGDITLYRKSVPQTAEDKEPPTGQKKDPEKPAPTNPAATTGYLVTPIAVDQMPKTKPESPPPPKGK